MSLTNPRHSTAELLGRRREAARAAVAEVGCDALLVTSPSNVRWLTDFTGSAGMVWLPASGAAVLVTDDRYAERAAEETGGMPLIIDRSWGWLAEAVNALPAAMGEHNLAGPAPSVALETANVTWAVVRTLGELLEQVDLVPSDALLMTLRQRKDDHEVAILRRACSITSAAFEVILGELRPGVTEQHVAGRLREIMRQMGADDEAFEPIVASGPNGSRPHHAPLDRQIEAGDLVTMDFGALVLGYHADMTRTVAVGDPSAELRRIHSLVRAAQAAGVAAVRDGILASAVDAACREPIRAAGHGDDFRHGTGHGVGLDIHEPPFLAAAAAGTLAAGMTVTVEPGVYVPGLGGVRIEDVVLVTDTGSESLTTAPRDLIIL